jgi:hypothetical protein
MRGLPPGQRRDRSTHRFRIYNDSQLAGFTSETTVFWSARSARFAYFRVGADQAVMARWLDAAPAVEPLTGLPPDTQHVSKRN